MLLETLRWEACEGHFLPPSDYLIKLDCYLFNPIWLSLGVAA